MRYLMVRSRPRGRACHGSSTCGPKKTCCGQFGTWKAILAALAISLVSKVVNISFVERQNGTDRNRNRRKVRKTYGFSKDWKVHESMTYFTMYRYNFCWPVRTLRVEVGEGQYEQRTPAMAAGLANHVWTIKEWITYPAIERIRSG